MVDFTAWVRVKVRLRVRVMVRARLSVCEYVRVSADGVAITEVRESSAQHGFGECV